ncbi:TRAP transporter small permease [Paradesulfitobacterium ferrireducens]|uniref:TRAP transporter small permease n=1 Tax=Paradesulfitobacterium ferrireducens TaxID=2816476 RepID=UPI001A8DC9A6|nr:TRAP transporter small permease [Paradesulfitobacterium ferrireducens]
MLGSRDDLQVQSVDGVHHRQRGSMIFSQLIKVTDKSVAMFNHILAWLAGLALLLMLIVVVGNAIVRVFYLPFPGTTELVGWLAAITTSFALGYTQMNKGNVALDMVTTKLPLRIQKFLEGIFALSTALFFGMSGWKIVSYGFTLKDSGYLSETLRLAYYPLLFVISLGFLGLTLTLLLEVIKLVEEGVKGGS